MTSYKCWIQIETRNISTPLREGEGGNWLQPLLICTMLTVLYLKGLKPVILIGLWASSIGHWIQWIY